MAGDHDRWRFGMGLGDQGVTRSSNPQVLTVAQRRLDQLRELVFIVGLTGDIHEGGGEVDDVRREIEVHVDTVAR